MRKTIITDSELNHVQKDMIDFIINEMNCSACLLTTYELPRTSNEALKVIEATKKRTTDDDKNWLLTKIETGVSGYKLNPEKKAIKEFVCYLASYNPT